MRCPRDILSRRGVQVSSVTEHWIFIWAFLSVWLLTDIARQVGVPWQKVLTAVTLVGFLSLFNGWLQ